jgi:hypothetical protein
MIPFTYLVKHIPTNRYYYGVRYKKGCHPYDLWTKYFTSSRKVKGLIKRYGKKSFIFEIRKTFKTAEQAYNWEHKVLKRMKVIHRDDFLNQSDNRQIDPKLNSKYSKGKNNPRYGVKLSKEQKKQISNSLKRWFKNPKNTHPWLGKKHSKKTIELFKKNNKGKNNPRYGVKITLVHKRKLMAGRNKYYAERKLA